MKSIRFKILMMAFVVTLLVATVISTYGTYRSKTMVEASNEAYIQSMANELALEMDNFIQMQKAYLEGQVNALTYIGDYSEENMAAFTFNMTNANGFMLYSYFNTLTDSGHFTSSDGWIPPEGYSWEDRYWVKLVSEMSPVFVDFPSYDSGTGNIVTVLRKRVMDYKVQGILNMAINLDELSQKLKSYEIPNGAETLLIDENGLLVAYHDPEIFKNQSEALLITDIIEGFNKDLSTFQSENMTYISAKLNDAPWVLWISVPNSFFYKGVSEAHFNNIEQMILAIIKDVSSLKTLDSLTVKVSLTAGGYVLDDIENGDDQGIAIIEKAESAMLSNQFNLNHEDNITWFDDALHQKRIYETQIESGLFEAIKRSEISVVYQPQYDQHGSIIGVEALMR